MGRSMTETDYLKPGDIQDQCTSATTTIENNNASLVVAKTSLAEFVSSGKQEGAAVDSLRDLISDFYAVADSVAVANGLDTADFNALSSGVGSEELDGSVIIPGMQTAKDNKESYESVAQQNNDLAMNPPHWWDYIIAGERLKTAQSYTLMAIWEQEKYDEYKRQKEAWEDIESSTSSLFTDTGIRGVIADAMANMNSCYYNGIYVPDRDASWREELLDAQDKTAKTALKHSGVTQEQIDYMCKELNYSPVELLNDWSMCQTDTDKEFFLHLMDGEDGYKEAFAIFPDDLSSSMALVLANYSGHLLVFDENGNLVEGEERFEKFNNAVLDSTALYAGYDEEDVEFGAPKYIEMLVAGSQILMQGDATVLAAYGPNAEGLQDLYSRYYSRVMSANIWSTEDAVRGLVSKRYDRQVLSSMKNLSITSIKDYGFDLNYMDGGNSKEVHVNGKTRSDTIDIDKAYDVSELVALRKEQDQLVQKTLVNIAADLAIAGLAVYCPPAAIAASGIKMVATQKASSPSGMSHYTDQWIKNYTTSQAMSVVNAETFTKGAKAGVSGGTSLLTNVINLSINMQAAEQAYNDKDREIFIQNFGMANTARVTGDGVDEHLFTYGGLYNPDALYLMGEWEANGCGDFVEFKDNMTPEEVLQEIENKGNLRKDSVEYEYAKKMLTGDGTLFSEDMDIVAFMDADDAISNYTTNGSGTTAFFYEEITDKDEKE